MPIKTIFCLLLYFTAFNALAKLNMMQSLYLVEPPSYVADAEQSFSMSGELGILFNSGNTQASSVLGSLKADQDLTHWNNRYIANILYKKNKQQIDDNEVSQTSAQRVFLSAQMDYKLPQANNRLFMYGEYEDSRFSGFRYQAAFAAGWTSALWADEKSEFKYSIGPGYAVSEQEAAAEQDGATDSGVIVRAAMEYKRKFSDTATFTQFVSTEADQDYAKSKAETALTAKINGSLAMKLSFTLDHNSAVEDETAQLDTKTAVTLVYQFF